MIKGIKSYTSKVFLSVVIAGSLFYQGQQIAYSQGYTQHELFLEGKAQQFVEDIYGDNGKASKRNNQWRGNCGRGKFLYFNKEPQDSNSMRIVTPRGPILPDDATITSNDIWVSRTGCWNPEERFVFMPPYSNFKRGKNLSVLTPDVPERVRNNILFMEPTFNQAFAYIPNKVPSLNPNPDNPESIWQPVDGAWDEPIGVSANAVTDWLVPNDRLLMPHPLCTNITDGSKNFFSPTGKKLKGTPQIGNLPSIPPWTAGLLKGSDVKDLVERQGSLPRCVQEDYLDDVDNFCEEYLSDNSFVGKLASNPALGHLYQEYNEKKYSSKRYFFDFDEFCWSSSERPIAYSYDPYEHWLPLAVKSTEKHTVDPNDPESENGWNRKYGVSERLRLDGQQHTYYHTDIRRPTFTPYSARTVVEVDNPDSKVHVQYSLEEYGYRDSPKRRIDYSYNPNNIYDPLNDPISPSELLKTDNIGRKAKMYKCLRMYIEQWAFEGDKGSIYLDSNEYAIREMVGGTGNDASMCQWVAYYDTSTNDQRRKNFKKIMKHFVKGSNSLGFSEIVDAPTKDFKDIRKLGCHEAYDGHLSDKKICRTYDLNLGVVNILDPDFRDTQNTFGMIRKVGMRPEAFDYFNFLTFSALPTPGFIGNPVGDANGGNPKYTERFNISHNVELSGGGVGVDGSSGVPKIKQLDDLYGSIIDFADTSLVGNLGINRVNFAKRECKTVSPPQVWNEVINMNSIADQCDFRKGARAINDVNYLREKNLPELLLSFLLNLIGFDFEIVPPDLKGRTYKHWLTTLVDAPVLSTVTPIPLLPVVGIGWNYEHGIESIFPYTDIKATRPPNNYVEFRDNLHRDGGKKAVQYHSLYQPDQGKRNMYHDTQTGIIVVDEKYGLSFPRARDWVNHAWPARSCMHSWRMHQVPFLGISAFKGFKNDPDKDADSYLYDAWKTYDDIRLDYLAGGEYEGSSYKFGADDFRQKYSDGKDDLNIDSRVFGGFKIWKDRGYYYSWLPTKWSMGVGIYKAFWCEFELPYFPYEVGEAEYEHNRKPIKAFYNINGKDEILGSRKLSKTRKPRLEYYRVERIRDGCGPFGVRSTWIDYDKNLGPTSDLSFKFFDWLIGDISTADGGGNVTIDGELNNYMIGARDWSEDQYYHLKSRCNDWIGMYRKLHNDPKAIGWRLARFDYEFMKSFLECTGPYQEKAPPVCKYNKKEHRKNNVEAACQIVNAEANMKASDLCVFSLLGVCLLEFGDLDIPYANVQCASDLISSFLPGNFCHSSECTSNTVDEDSTETVMKAIDYSTRGDSTFKHYPDDDSSHGFERNHDDLDEDKGFETWDKNSIQINKFWLRSPGDDFEVPGDEPFGFWCSCPSEKKGYQNHITAKTTRCREDFCTCEQHVLFPSRWASLPWNIPYSIALGVYGDAVADGDPENIEQVAFTEILPIEIMSGLGGFTSGRPTAICADYGPFRRWIQCFYQARASACPVITRDVSDSIPYSSLKDPFTGDKRAKDALPENSQKRQSYNVCDEGHPIGHGNKDTEGFIRWSLEEPNHLARIPVWFESGGAAFGHEDLIFQSQVRDYEAPFMELAVPFPIDLITRHCAKWGTRKIKKGDRFVEVQACVEEAMDKYPSITNPLFEKASNAEAGYPDNLSEIMQREGSGYQIAYHNPPSPGSNVSIVDEFIAKSFKASFRSSLLLTRDTSRLIPVIESEECLLDNPDPASNLKCDSKKYQGLYFRYAQGLYAAAASYSFTAYPDEPGNPTILSSPSLFPGDEDEDGTDKQNIDPRAQDKIVGPRGCDIGGWWEMMLYQARCIRWHKLNCICDYDKTFARGNAVNYALKRAGAKFEVLGPVIRDAQLEVDEGHISKVGNYYSVLDDSERTAAGVDKNIDLGQFGGGSSSRSNSRTFAKYKVNPQTGLPELVSVIGGEDIDKVSQYKPAVAAGRPIHFPLKDRGFVGPEFALKNTEEWDDEGFKLVGLDHVKVGDLLIWDEEITDNYIHDLDVGYPRHIAYVEEVTRVKDVLPLASPKLPMSIKVAEMNWGKIYDSCGNTNRWNVETRRTIHRPVCSSLATSCEYEYRTLPDPNNPGFNIAGSIDKYADCRNSDWAVCVEKYWDKVKVYRPYMTTLDDEIDTIPDPAYHNSACEQGSLPQKINKDKQIEILEQLMSDNVLPSPAQEDSIKNNQGDYNMHEVRKYIYSLYNRGDLGLEYILYETDIWKLLVTEIDYGKYYVDEVNQFLFNPLRGAADNCDPLPVHRSNFNSNLDEARELKGLFRNLPGG